MCRSPSCNLAGIRGFPPVSKWGEAAAGLWSGGACRARWVRAQGLGLVAGRVAPAEREDLRLLDSHGGRGRRDHETLLGNGFPFPASANGDGRPAA